MGSKRCSGAAMLLPGRKTKEHNIVNMRTRLAARPFEWDVDFKAMHRSVSERRPFKMLKATRQLRHRRFALGRFFVVVFTFNYWLHINYLRLHFCKGEQMLEKKYVVKCTIIPSYLSTLANTYK